MALIVSHGDKHKDSFEGWHGTCICGCRFILQKGDSVSFTGVPMTSIKSVRPDGIILPYENGTKLLFQATAHCPDCNAPFVSVSLFPDIS